MGNISCVVVLKCLTLFFVITVILVTARRNIKLRMLEPLRNLSH